MYCAVEHDLACYYAGLEEEEERSEYCQGVADNMIATFQEEGSCRMTTGYTSFQDYDLGDLMTNIFEKEHADTATSQLMKALKAKSMSRVRAEFALAFVELLEDQLIHDLEEMSLDAFEDDSP